MKPKCNHEKQPEGYIAWHEWAEKKAKTHRQIKCKHCGKFVIWVLRNDTR